MWEPKKQVISDDLRTRVTLIEQLCSQLVDNTRRAEADCHDRSLKEQDTLLTLSRVADGLNNLSAQVIANREFFEKVISKNDVELQGKIKEMSLEVTKSSTFVNNARWGFTALWAFVVALALDVLGVAVKHWLK